jgi:hypothetical protein
MPPRASQRLKDPCYAVGTAVECHFGADAGESRYKGVISAVHGQGFYDVHHADDDTFTRQIHWSGSAMGGGHGLLSLEDKAIVTPKKLEGRGGAPGGKPWEHSLKG